MANTKRVKILNTETGENLSMKAFKEESLEKISDKYILLSDIIDKKILSRGKLEKLVLSGILKECVFYNRKYVDKIELFKYLSKMSKPAK